MSAKKTLSDLAKTIKKLNWENKNLFGDLLETRNERRKVLKVKTERRKPQVKADSKQNREVVSSFSYSVLKVSKSDQSEAKRTVPTVDESKRSLPLVLDSTSNISSEGKFQSELVKPVKNSVMKLGLDLQKYQLFHPQVPSPQSQINIGFMPSVTSILSETMPEESRLALEKWRAKMIAQLGEEGFRSYETELLENGKRLHAVVRERLEGKLEGELSIDASIAGYWRSLGKTLDRVSEVKCLEKRLTHSVLPYKGIVDCVAKYRSAVAVIDWKTAQRSKPHLSHLYDAPLQVAAYMGAWNSICPPENQISHGLIVVAYSSGDPAHVHLLTKSKCLEYWSQPVGQDQEIFFVGLEGKMSSKVKELLEDFWTWRLDEAPEFSTLIGHKERNGKLDSWSFDSLNGRLNAVEKFKERIHELQSGEDLTKMDKDNLECFEEDLRLFIEGFKFKGYLYPVNFIEGPQVDLDRMINEWTKYEDEADYTMLLSRFRQIPQQLQEVELILDEGIRSNLTLHKLSLTGVENQFEKLQGDPENTPFFKPFLNFPKAISDEQQVALKTQAKELIKDQIQPALEKLQRFLKEKYEPNCRPHVGCTTLPNGKEYYQQCLRYHTSTDLSPEEIHKIGLSEVESIEKQMKKIISSLGRKEEIREFMESIRTDPQFAFDSPDELLDGYRKILEKDIEPKLPSIVLHAPKLKI
ncbi:unnamed protein product, partial [Darwinula stevensoni]